MDVNIVEKPLTQLPQALPVEIHFGFTPVTHSIQFNPGSIIKGKKVAKDNIKSIKEISGIEKDRYILAKIRKTTKPNELYDVHLQINENRHVTYCFCSCLSGEAKHCKHIFGLIYYVQTCKNESKTSYEQSWNKKPTQRQFSDEEYSQPIEINEVFLDQKYLEKKAKIVPEKLLYDRFAGLTCPLEIAIGVQSSRKDEIIIRNLLNELVTQAVELVNYDEFKETASILYLHASETEKVYTENRILSDVNLNSYYNTNIKVSEKDIINICAKTVTQSNLKEWYDVRSVRISASSKVHEILSKIKLKEQVEKSIKISKAVKKSVPAKTKISKSKAVKKSAPVKTKISKSKTVKKNVLAKTTKENMPKKVFKKSVVKKEDNKVIKKSLVDDKIKNLNISSDDKIKNLNMSSDDNKNKKTIDILDDLAMKFIDRDKKPKFTSKATDYGIVHEKTAIDEYSKKYGVEVKSVGVFIMPHHPWLCASPDGMIADPVNTLDVKLLEIKCPKSCDNKPIVGKDKINVTYLERIKGQVYLKTKSKYYCQCQIQMYCTGTFLCDFYIWSPKGSQLVHVFRDEQFLNETLPKLQNFYFDHYLKALSKI